MVQDLFFLEEAKVKITAASVGISKKRWISIREDEDEGKKHKKIMAEFRIDHLPIVSNSGIITSFYQTKTAEYYEEIEKHSISYKDTLPIETDIQTIIYKFNKENRVFYFLTFNNDISGLITIGNLNCKQVQVYVFSLVCELERELQIFLDHNITKEMVIQWLETKSNNSENPKNNKYLDIINEYKSLAESGLENNITEHFYLVDFFGIIRDKDLYLKLSHSKSEWDKYNSINMLRNKIAHPTRSLIDKNNPLKKLYERMTKVNDLIFKLRNYKALKNY